MGLLNALSAIEPTNLLKTILITEGEVLINRNRYTIIRKSLQGGLLFSASVVGVAACASAIFSLIPDIVFKSARLSIRGIRYIIQWTFLDKLHRKLERPSFAYRIERIISQVLGVQVSALGLLLLPFIRDDWALRQHESLRNYDTSKSPLPPDSTKRPLPSIPQASSGASIPSKTTGIPPTVELSPTSPPMSVPPPPSQSSQIPPPPPPPPISGGITSSSAPGKVVKPSPEDLQKAMKGIKTKGQEEQKKRLSTQRVRKLARENTLITTLKKGMANVRQSMRPQSEKISFNVEEGFQIKANKVTLKEVVDELMMTFDWPKDQMDATLSDFILSKFGEASEEGETIPFENFDITIIKLAERGVIAEAHIKLHED